MGLSGLSVLILLVIVAALVARIWRGTTLPRGAPREPACGACDYPVRGLGSLNCPECGADLREVGIVAPHMLVRWRGSATGLVVAWSLVVAVAGVPVAIFLGSGALRYVDQRLTTRLVSDADGYAIALEVHSQGRSGAPRAREILLSLSDPAGVPAGVLRVEPDLDFAGEAADGSETMRGERLDGAAIARWLASRGMQAEAPTADGLFDAVRASVESPGVRPTSFPGLRTLGGGLTSMSTIPPWYWWAVSAILGSVWAAGTYLLLKGRRSLLRESTARGRHVASGR